MTDWFNETLHSNIQQRFKVDEVLFHEKSEFQDVIIFKNAIFGRILALDGVIQVTEGDEFIYHEMMSHVPLLSHPNPQRVLIIGGGDGGVLRECLKHPIQSATLVELDSAVVDMCSKHMPTIPQQAFTDPRTEIIYADGCQFVKNTRQRYDVIIVDSTDPIGPGAVLFTEEFYRDCQQILTADGIMVTQNGVPFLQGKELRDSVGHFRKLFADASCYTIAVPTYYGGFMSLGWASNNIDNRKRPQEAIEQRSNALNLQTRYYNPALHKGAFAVPQYVQQQMA